MEENIKKVKDMILDQLEAEDVTDIAKNIRNDFTENDVYVFSPRGDVFNLPQVQLRLIWLILFIHR